METNILNIKYVSVCGWLYILSNTYATFEAKFIKKLSSTEAELKKGLLIKKACNSAPQSIFPFSCVRDKILLGLVTFFYTHSNKELKWIFIKLYISLCIVFSKIWGTVGKTLASLQFLLSKGLSFFKN